MRNYNWILCSFLKDYIKCHVLNEKSKQLSVHWKLQFSIEILNYFLQCVCSFERCFRGLSGHLCAPSYSHILEIFLSISSSVQLSANRPLSTKCWILLSQMNKIDIHNHNRFQYFLFWSLREFSCFQFVRHIRFLLYDKNIYFTTLCFGHFCPRHYVQEIFKCVSLVVSLCVTSVLVQINVCVCVCTAKRWGVMFTRGRRE